MKKVTVYTTRFCPYCIKALRLLDSKKVDYLNINVNKEPTQFEAVKKQTGWRTVPQIFIDEQFIGGCDDMYQLDAEGKLDDLLGL
ncbi:glutaredoxin 3 [Fusibacter ferrireducens]|uniref:Glutaredoxin n=1 Tax=Fusibacter ferrireducens TaxID=2785058 RepID=A0ABR9ZRK4_9FIRM|nr:glutaredoxin 3 [Fusibacter ferrireducens]MBF4692611.1 glutaredoxin 3 [Fusibacter ferrireducens]